MIARVLRMLKQRVITAVVLLAILLPALFWPSPVPFAVVTLLMLAAGAWEWGRLNGLGQAGSVAAAVACLALCAASWSAGLLERPMPVLWSVAGAALGAGRGLAAARWAWRAGRTSLGQCGSSAGVLALWLAWLAVVQARVFGINFLLSVLVLVWVADIAAYFGGPRLRP